MDINKESRALYILAQLYQLPDVRVANVYNLYELITIKHGEDVRAEMVSVVNLALNIVNQADSVEPLQRCVDEGATSHIEEHWKDHPAFEVFRKRVLNTCLRQ